MRVLIFTHYFPPEVRSAANLMFELSEELKNRGYDVTVLTIIPEGASELLSKYKSKMIINEFENGKKIVRVRALSVHTRNLPAVVRGIGQLINSVVYFGRAIFEKDIDVIIAYSPPLPIGLTSFFIGSIKKAPFIFNLQDLVPQYAIDLGTLKNKWIIKFLKGMEKFIYRKAKYIVVHSDGNRKYLIDEGIKNSKAITIPNWVDTEEIQPTSKLTEFRIKNHLKEQFIVLFAGMIAYAQDLDTIIESAKYLTKYEEIVYCIVGEGVEKERLISKAKSLDLNNVRFFPFVSKEKYPDVVSASDVCIVSLRKNLKTPVVPSKILGYMAAGRPIVASLHLEGDAPAIIRDAKCGVCVEPGRPELLAAEILDLYQNKEKCVQFESNARNYAVKNFDKKRCITKYENLFS